VRLLVRLCFRLPVSQAFYKFFVLQFGLAFLAAVGGEKIGRNRCGFDNLKCNMESVWVKWVAWWRVREPQQPRVNVTQSVTLR